TIYGDPDRYVTQYWSKNPGKYTTGDSAKRDKDGYFWIIGRVDDVIKVSGHRLGTAEVESALVSNPAVAEAAAIGLPHELKGQGIYTFVLLRTGFTPSPELAEELRQHVATHMGPIARPEDVKIIDKLPKTRSGKIMRRVLKARAQGLPEGDISTWGGQGHTRCRSHMPNRKESKANLRCLFQQRHRRFFVKEFLNLQSIQGSVYYKV